MGLERREGCSCKEEKSAATQEVRKSVSLRVLVFYLLMFWIAWGGKGLLVCYGFLVPVVAKDQHSVMGRKEVKTI